MKPNEVKIYGKRAINSSPSKNCLSWKVLWTLKVCSTSLETFCVQRKTYWYINIDILLRKKIEIEESLINGAEAKKTLNLE